MLASSVVDAFAAAGTLLLSESSAHEGAPLASTNPTPSPNAIRNCCANMIRLLCCSRLSTRRKKSPCARSNPQGLFAVDGSPARTPRAISILRRESSLSIFRIDALRPALEAAGENRHRRACRSPQVAPRMGGVGRLSGPFGGGRVSDWAATEVLKPRAAIAARRRRSICGQIAEWGLHRRPDRNLQRALRHLGQQTAARLYWFLVRRTVRTAATLPPRQSLSNKSAQSPARRRKVGPHASRDRRSRLHRSSKNRRGESLRGAANRQHVCGGRMR